MDSREPDILERAHEAYQRRSEALSNLTRQLAFAGIAVVWVFRMSSSGRDVLRPELLWPTLLLVSCLAFDLLHYVSATIAFGVWRRCHECKGTSPSVFPSWINWPALIFFWLKVAAVAVAYGMLLWFLGLELAGTS